MNNTSFNDQVKYYRENYDQVAIVTCMGCGNPIAFELKGGRDNAGNPTHHEGFEVVPVSYPEHPQGMALMSWRARTDGVTGYQCCALVENPDYKTDKEFLDQTFAETVAQFKTDYKGVKLKDRPAEPVKPDLSTPEFNYCGNNTLLATAERGKVPGTDAPMVPTMTPFEREQLGISLKLSGNKPDVEVDGATKRVETFKIERVK
jgi:hypothetical protein